MRFSVILPVFNQPGYTEKCIRALYETKAEFDLLVIDNGSLLETKNVLQRLVELFHFRVLAFETNRGWARAVNEGLKNITIRDYVVLLQNDCFVFSDFFEVIKKNIDFTDPQASVFLPRTCYSRSSQLRASNASAFSAVKHSNKGMPKKYEWLQIYLKEFYGSHMPSKMEERKAATYCCDIDSYCMIVDGEVFRSELFFHEAFKTLGWVEKEWYARLLDKGHEAWIINDLYVHHHGNLTTDGNGWNYGRLLAEDERLYKELTNGR